MSDEAPNHPPETDHEHALWREAYCASMVAYPDNTWASHAIRAASAVRQWRKNPMPRPGKSSHNAPRL